MTTSACEIESPNNPIMINSVWYQRLLNFLPITFLPWMMVSYVSVMAGGAPRVVIPLWVYVILWVLWTFPITALISMVIAKRLHQRGKIQEAILVLSLPSAFGMLICLALIAPFAYGFVLYCMGQL